MRELIRADFDQLLARERFDVSAADQRLILIQTVESRANGHGAFRRAASSTSPSRRRPRAAARRREGQARPAEVDNDVFGGSSAPGRRRRTALVDADGKPAFSVPFLADFAVGPRPPARHIRRRSTTTRDVQPRWRPRPHHHRRRLLLRRGRRRHARIDLDSEKLSTDARRRGSRVPRTASSSTAAEKVDDNRYRSTCTSRPGGPGTTTTRPSCWRARFGRGHAWGFPGRTIDTLESIRRSTPTRTTS